MKKKTSRVTLIMTMVLVTALVISAGVFSVDRQIEVDGRTYVELGISAREHGYRVSVREEMRGVSPLCHERSYKLSYGTNEHGTMSYTIEDGRVSSISYGGNLVHVKHAFRDAQVHNGRIYVSSTAFEDERETLKNSTLRVYERG